MCVADAVLLFCLLCFQGLTLQDENKKRKQQNVVLGPQTGACIDFSWYAFKMRINQNKQCKVKGLPWWWGRSTGEEFLLLTKMYLYLVKKELEVVI